MIKKTPTRVLLSAATALCFTASTFAGMAGKEMKTVVEKTKESCITGDLGVNFGTHYVSRGYVLENQGVIAQPYADIYFKVYSGDGFINSVTLGIGIWASLHSEKTDQGLVNGTGTSSTPSWYEFDYYPSIAIGFAKNFTLTLSYLEFNYPNDGFFTQRLGQIKLAYNDSELWGGGFALNPYVKYEYFFETPDGASYFEVGIAPGFQAGPVKVSIPIVAGFGADDFYVDGAGNNESFGYVSGGVSLAYPLTFVPECYGSWTLTAGYTFYYLGDGLENFNTAPGGAVRDASETEHVFSGGIGMTF